MDWKKVDNDCLPRESIIFKCLSQVVVGRLIFWAGHERFVSDDGHVVFKKHLLFSFDLIGHSFQVHDIDSVFRDGLTIPMCLSSIGNSLILSGITDETDSYLFCGWSVLVDVTSLTSFTLLFAIPTPNYVKLLGFTMDEISLPIVEVPGPHQLANSYKESLILLPYPDHELYHMLRLLDLWTFSNEIRVNDGISKLMLLIINLLLQLLVHAVKHILTAVSQWERQIQAIVDKKKVIITEKSIRSDLKLNDAEGWNEFSSTTTFVIICLATNQNFNFSKYNFDNMIKNLEGGVKFLMYPRLVNEIEERNDEEMLFDVDDDLQGEEVVIEEVVEKEISTADPVTTAGEVVTTASIEVTTTSDPTTTIDELTMAQTLIKIKAAKPKVVTTDATTVTIRPKEKGVVIEEPSETITTKTITTTQPSSKDKEQAELERVQRERDAQEEASRAAVIEELDNIQAMIKADEQLAARLQTEEQEQFSIEQKSRMLVNTFVPMDSDVVEGSKKAKADTEQVSSTKRACEELEQAKAKKESIDEHVEEEKESEGLNQCFEIVPKDGDDVTIDATPLSTRSPNIVDYKIYKKGKKRFFQIIRADVKDRFKKTETENYMDNYLLLTLKTMFEHHFEDSIWKKQQGLTKVNNWKLFYSCGVYCVTIQSLQYYMLVEKKYSLTYNTLHQMFNDVKLHVGYECEMAYELLRLVKRQPKGGYITE
ncbi:hypothetical protein Tco_0576578 [Tanacetum coccineum]